MRKFKGCSSDPWTTSLETRQRPGDTERQNCGLFCDGNGEEEIHVGSPLCLA